MNLSPAEKQIVTRALEIAIESRLIDRNSYRIPSGKGRGIILFDDKDITQEVRTDLREFRAMLRTFKQVRP